MVCVGGGLGAPTVMAGMRAHTDDITGIIAVTDSGRSTGKVRIALDVPAPGDIRSAIAVIAEGDPVLRRLFSHRFETDNSTELIGMAFGNLFLAALAQQEGSFLRAVEEAARLLAIRGEVLPVTLWNMHLCAKLADVTVVAGRGECPRRGPAAYRTDLPARRRREGRGGDLRGDRGNRPHYARAGLAVHDRLRMSARARDRADDQPGPRPRRVRRQHDDAAGPDRRGNGCPATSLPYPTTSAARSSTWPC